MNELLKKFQPIDVIAIFILACGFILVGFGIDSFVGGTVAAVVLAYFGKKEIVDKVRERQLPGAKAETVEAIIKRVALNEGVDPNLALRVAKCESGLNPGVINTNANGSQDRGLYQINTRWHPEVNEINAFEPEKSTRFFCRAVKAGHLDWWNATKKCWNI